MICSSIKNIVFDIGGVLVDLDKDICVNSFKAIGFERAESIIDYYSPAEFFKQLELGNIDTKEVCQCIRREANNDNIADIDIVNAYRSFLVSLPIYKLRLIKSLKDAGYMIYALSNINEVVMPLLTDDFFRQDGLTMDDYFHKSYLSYQMGALKPTPEIYQMMIDDSGMVPSETLFIDDSVANINTAQELGFNVYLAAAQEDFSHIFDDILKK